MSYAAAAFDRGAFFTSSSFTQHALQWLWSYTLELPPVLFGYAPGTLADQCGRVPGRERGVYTHAVQRNVTAPISLGSRHTVTAFRAPAALVRRATSSAQAGMRLACKTHAPLEAALAALPPPQRTRDMREIAQRTATLHAILDALADADAVHILRSVRKILDTTIAFTPTRETASALQNIRLTLGHRIQRRLNACRDTSAAWQAAQVETLLLQERVAPAMDLFGALLAEHEALLVHTRTRADAGHMQRQRSDPVLTNVYKAQRAVLLHRVEQVQLALALAKAPRTTELGAPAAHFFAWAVRHPLVFALVQPAFPKVCQAMYTLLAALPDPVDKVRDLLKHEQRTRVATRAISLLAIAHANRGTPELGARIAIEAADQGMLLPEPILRKILRVLIQTQRRRVVIAPLIAQLDARKSLSRSTLTILVQYHAEMGDSDAMHARLAALSLSGEQPFARRAQLILASSHGMADAVRSMYEAEFGDMHAMLHGTRNANATHHHGTPPSFFVYYYLRAFAKRDNEARARAVFDAYAQHAVPTPRMYGIMLGLASRMGRAEEAMRLVAEMETRNVPVTSETLVHLVHALGRARVPERAATLMQHYPNPSRRVYNALMNAYVEAGGWSEALGILRWMQSQPEASLQPDAASYTTIIKAHVLRGTPIAHVLDRLLWMRSQGMLPDERTYALVLASACDSGQRRLAESIFQLVDEALQASHGGATVYHYTVLIHALLRAGDTASARGYVEQMRARGIAPSRVTYSVLIKSYANSDEDSAALATDLALLRTLEAETNADAPPSRVPALEQGYVYEDLLVPLIDAHARRAELHKADELFARLLATGAPVSTRAMTAMLNAHRRAADVDGVLRIWEQVYAHALQRCEATPSFDAQCVPGLYQRNMLCMPLSIVIDALSRAGQHKRVAAIWVCMKRDGFAFDAHNWNHLAAALARADRLREAMQLIERVLPHKAPSARAEIHAEAIGYAFANDPLFHAPLPSADGAWEPQTSAPFRPPTRRSQPRSDDVEGDMRLFFEGAPAQDVPSCDDSVLLRPSETWHVSFDTLSAMHAAVERHRKVSRARKRPKFAPPREMGAEALASDAPHAHESITELFHLFPTAAQRLAEYEQRVEADSL
ncbi:hypothetical protein MVES1_003637 [Malassezia vespertilionis]|nr:uncharacterized protein MVES1_003637 [Malassezia vespertilionis]WFD08265.1 hypothetical protein MVES1_003637 [Malassezia vespertilionis]